MEEFTLKITLPLDEDGYTGRECPECGEYFKVKFGTGLNTETCYCPYCKYQNNYDNFRTEDQQKYIDSIIEKDINDRFVEPLLNKLNSSLRKLEQAGDGKYLKIKVQSNSKKKFIPIKSYQEKDLETEIICDNCKLEFAIFGVFSTCPDCQELSAISIFKNSLISVTKRISLAKTQTDKDLIQSLYEDALSGCISAFDGLGKALQSEYNKKLPKVRNLFQKIGLLSEHLEKTTGKRISQLIGQDDYNYIVELFNARHLFEHNFGEIDEDFIKKVPKYKIQIKKKYQIDEARLVKLINIVSTLSEKIIIVLKN